MILVDSSVWIEHFRSRESPLQPYLNEGRVLLHPFVIGELACGNFRDRARVLRFLQLLPLAVSADHKEVLYILDKHALWGRGIGYIDAHLLSSALVTNCFLWSLDQRLAQVAEKTGVKLLRRQMG